MVQCGSQFLSCISLIVKLTLVSCNLTESTIVLFCELVTNGSNLKKREKKIHSPLLFSTVLKKSFLNFPASNCYKYAFPYFFSSITTGTCCLGCICAQLLQLHLTLCDPVNCSLPGYSVHRILQAKILEWVAMPFSRGSSWPRDQTCISCIAGRFFITESLRKDNWAN